MLTPEDRHAASPRLTNDGLTIVYFDNELSTGDRYLVPGPQNKSRKLKKFNLAEAEMESKKAAQNGQLGIDVAELIVDDVQEVVTMHDGSTFYGLYPKFPLPDRCFSNDHVMYMTIYQVGSLRSIAVDLNTKQVIMIFFPQNFLPFFPIFSVFSRNFSQTFNFFLQIFLTFTQLFSKGK